MEEKDKARFWIKVDKNNENDGCWEWLASKDKDNYGKFATGPRGAQKHFKAHRVAYELVNGQIPQGMSVLHRCDNPSCVRPDHLFVGTQKDNIKDMMSKGRGKGKVARRIRNDQLHSENIILKHENEELKEAIKTLLSQKTDKIASAISEALKDKAAHSLTVLFSECGLLLPKQ